MISIVRDTELLVETTALIIVSFTTAESFAIIYITLYCYKQKILFKHFGRWFYVAELWPQQRSCKEARESQGQRQCWCQRHYHCQKPSQRAALQNWHWFLLQGQHRGQLHSGELVLPQRQTGGTQNLPGLWCSGRDRSKAERVICERSCNLLIFAISCYWRVLFGLLKIKAFILPVT